MLLVLKQPRHDEIDRRKIMIPRRGICEGCLKKPRPDSPVLVPGIDAIGLQSGSNAIRPQQTLLTVGRCGQVVT
jgi:hypothetical protein